MKNFYRFTLKRAFPRYLHAAWRCIIEKIVSGTGAQHLRLSLLLFALVILNACSVQKQIYAEKKVFAAYHIKNIIVQTKCGDVEVKSFRDIPALAVLLMPFAFVHLAVFAQYSADVSAASSLQQDSIFHRTLNKFESHFINGMLQSGLFSSVNNRPQQANSQLEASYNEDNCDAVIKLDIYEITMRKKAGDKLALCLSARATMTANKDNSVLWHRSETLESDETYTHDFLKQNGIPILDKYLEKIAYRFENDIIYAQ